MQLLLVSKEYPLVSKTVEKIGVLGVIERNISKANISRQYIYIYFLLGILLEIHLVQGPARYGS